MPRVITVENNSLKMINISKIIESNHIPYDEYIEQVIQTDDKLFFVLSEVSNETLSLDKSIEYINDMINKLCDNKSIDDVFSIIYDIYNKDYCPFYKEKSKKYEKRNFISDFNTSREDILNEIENIPLNINEPLVGDNIKLTNNNIKDVISIINSTESYDVKDDLENKQDSTIMIAKNIIDSIENDKVITERFDVMPEKEENDIYTIKEYASKLNDVLLGDDILINHNKQVELSEKYNLLFDELRKIQSQLDNINTFMDGYTKTTMSDGKINIESDWICKKETSLPVTYESVAAFTTIKHNIFNSNDERKPFVEAVEHIMDEKINLLVGIGYKNTTVYVPVSNVYVYANGVIDIVIQKITPDGNPLPSTITTYHNVSDIKSITLSVNSSNINHAFIVTPINEQYIITEVIKL